MSYESVVQYFRKSSKLMICKNCGLLVIQLLIVMVITGGDCDRRQPRGSACDNKEERSRRQKDDERDKPCNLEEIAMSLGIQPAIRSDWHQRYGDVHMTAP